MAALEVQRHEVPEVLNLPPAATPSSPLDDDDRHHDRHIPSSVFASSNAGFYTPQQHHQNHSQSTLQQPLIQPFSETASIAASSIAPSTTTTTTPRNPTTTTPRYPTEEAYLSALRAWAHEKQYAQLGGTLEGFYGREELQERAQRMTEERRVYKEGKARMKAVQREQRRGTVAAPEGGEGGRRRGSVVDRFFRRGSAAV